MRPIFIEQKYAPAYETIVAIDEVQDKNPWYYNIWNFLEKEMYPLVANTKDKRGIRCLAIQFIICGGKLYKRGHLGMHKLCVEEEESKRLMVAIHGGECGAHMNDVMLARKILRQGYYWSTIVEDCISFVQRCHKCQIHANRINIQLSKLYNMTSPWPFLVWGIDVIGAVTPKGLNGHEFILVAIDYLTKWVKAQSYFVLKKASHVAKFIKNNIICRYGVLNETISNNGSHFKKEVLNLLEKYNIAFHKSSTYRLQTNGVVEAANKNINDILRKMSETYKDWPDKLPFALCDY